jgi:hypothetical protein
MHATLLKLATVLLLPSVSFAAFASDPPAFRKGMWQFTRTVEGQGAGGKPVTMTSKKCADPSADMKRMKESLSKQGCKFTAPTVNGNTYTASSECIVQGVPVQSQSVVTVEGDSAYRLQITSSGGGRSTKELLIAKRVGEC